MIQESFSRPMGPRTHAALISMAILVAGCATATITHPMTAPSHAATTVPQSNAVAPNVASNSTNLSSLPGQSSPHPSPLAIAANQNERSAFAVIFGQVRDATTKAPIPDAVVTVTGPNLNEKFIVKTDPDGQFRIPQLPPGKGYVVVIEAGTGYKPSGRAGIDLDPRASMRLNVEVFQPIQPIIMGSVRRTFMTL